MPRTLKPVQTHTALGAPKDRIMNTSSTAATVRNDGLDALRGLFLVLMTLTHLPTALSDWLGQPFGFVSAAEGFVMLSAFLAGQVYLKRGMKQGPAAMRDALWARAGKVYRHHLGLLIFGATLVLAIGLVNEQDAVTSIFKNYLDNPVPSAIAAATLVYQPSLFDILPMYILFLLCTPLVLSYVLRKGWTVPMAASGMVWLGAQMGLRTWIYDGVVALTGFSMPLQATGAFNPFAWQFLWMVGMWLGTARLLGENNRMQAQPRVLALIAVLAASFLAWRHTAGQVPFENTQEWGMALNHLLDKWDLGPLRLLNFFALSVLVAAFGPAVARRMSLGALSLLGRSSLSVFSAHLVCCLLALALFGPAPHEGGLTAQNVAMDLLVLVTGFAVLFGVAAFNEAPDAAPVSRPVVGSGGAIPAGIPMPVLAPVAR